MMAHFPPDDIPWDDDSDQYTYLSSMPSSTHSRRFVQLSQSPLPPVLSAIPPPPRHAPGVSPALLYDHLQAEAQRQEQYQSALRNLLHLEQDFLAELKSIWMNERSSLYQLTNKRNSDLLSTSGSKRTSLWKFKSAAPSTALKAEGVECIFAGLEKVIQWHDALLASWKNIQQPSDFISCEMDTKGMSCHLNYVRNHLEAMLTVERMCRQSPKAALILDNEDFLAKLTRPFDYLYRLAEFVERVMAFAQFTQQRVSMSRPTAWIEFLQGLKSTHQQIRKELDGFQPYLEVLDVQAQFEQLPGQPLTSDPKRRLICDGQVVRRKRAGASGRLQALPPQMVREATESWFLFSDMLIRAKMLPNGRLKWKESTNLSSMTVYSITPSNEHDMKHGVTLSIAGRAEDVIAQCVSHEEKNRWVQAFTNAMGKAPKRRSHVAAYSAAELLDLTGTLIMSGGGYTPYKHKSESTSNLNKYIKDKHDAMHKRKGSIPNVFFNRNSTSSSSNPRSSMQSTASSSTNVAGGGGRRYVYQPDDDPDELYGGTKASVDSFGMWSARPI